jgi:Flp pilus assembly secretin CpaC
VELRQLFKVPTSKLLGVSMLKRSLVAFAVIAATTLASTIAASAREPVIVKVKATADKDQSRIVSDPSLKAQKFSDFVASEMP